MAADLLRASRSTSAEAIADLKNDSSLTSAAQPEVLKYLADQGDNPRLLASRAWQIASVSGRSAEDYTRALALATSAIQSAPWLPDGSGSRALGAAYYRMQRYTEALTYLQSAMRVFPQGGTDVNTLAFTAMANQRLGRTYAARAALKRLENFKGGNRLISPALAQEAAAVVRGTNLPSK